jgi:hypothetical protein
MIKTLTTAIPSRAECPSPETHSKTSSTCRWATWPQGTKLCSRNKAVKHWTKDTVRGLQCDPWHKCPTQGFSWLIHGDQLRASSSTVLMACIDTHIHFSSWSSGFYPAAHSRHHHAQWFSNLSCMRSSKIFLALLMGTFELYLSEKLKMWLYLKFKCD